MARQSSVTPAKLRLILSCVLVAELALGVGAFVFGQGIVAGYAKSDQESAANALASNSNLQNLVATKDKLSNLAPTIERADQLASQSKSYLYQDQIISDLNKYADQSGIKIINITFESAKTAGAGAAKPGAAATPATGAGAPAGVKSMKATVTLSTPIKYAQMLDFVHRIEQSLFKMQISQVNISRNSDTANPDTVVSDSLTIEVYVR